MQCGLGIQRSSTDVVTFWGLLLSGTLSARGPPPARPREVAELQGLYCVLCWHHAHCYSMVSTFAPGSQLHKNFFNLESEMYLKSDFKGSAWQCQCMRLSHSQRLDPGCVFEVFV